MFYVCLYIYLGTVGAAFFVSLRSFRFDYPSHLKMFSVLIGLSFFVEFTVTVIFPFLKINSNYRSAMYTSFSLVEFELYAYFFYKIISIRWVKKAIKVYIFLFPVFWAITVFKGYGFLIWDSAEIAMGGFFTVCFCLVYIYYLSLSEQLIALSKHAEFWIVIGLILFYSCEIPYLGMLNFLNKNYPDLSLKALYASMSIDSIMYGLFIYAYLCRNRKY